jgi:type II secretory pathway pseudopilin PulG
MSRRYLLTTVGIILGALALGLYFSQVNAADKSATISQLLARINALEQRVQALEHGGGAIFLPDQRPGDGFGPVRTIPIDTTRLAK